MVVGQVGRSGRAVREYLPETNAAAGNRLSDFAGMRHGSSAIDSGASMRTVRQDDFTSNPEAWLAHAGDEPVEIRSDVPGSARVVLTQSEYLSLVSFRNLRGGKARDPFSPRLSA